MCGGRCGGKQERVLKEGIWYLKHYCFFLVHGFDWVFEPQSGQEEKEQQ
jgi:hypothetical protein